MYTDGFYTFYVSQGSVATQLRCGGMFSNHFTTNFSQYAAVKKNENLSIFGKYMGKILWLTFLGYPVEALFQRTTNSYRKCMGVATYSVDPAAAGPIIWQTRIFMLTLYRLSLT